MIQGGIDALRANLTLLGTESEAPSLLGERARARRLRGYNEYIEFSYLITISRLPRCWPTLGEERKQEFLVLEADKFANCAIVVDARFGRNKSGAVTNRS